MVTAIDQAYEKMLKMVYGDEKPEVIETEQHKKLASVIDWLICAYEFMDESHLNHALWDKDFHNLLEHMQTEVARKPSANMKLTTEDCKKIRKDEYLSMSQTDLAEMLMNIDFGSSAQRPEVCNEIRKWFNDLELEEQEAMIKKLKLGQP